MRANFTAIGALVIGLLGVAPSVGHAAGACVYGDSYVQFGTTVADSGVSNSSDCIGIFDLNAGSVLITDTVRALGSPSTPGQQTDNEAILNSAGGTGLGGITDWQLTENLTFGSGLANVTTSDVNGFGFSATRDNGTALGSGSAAFGKWTVAEWNGVTSAAILMLGDKDEWAVYLLNGLPNDGLWQFVKSQWTGNPGTPSKPFQHLKAFQLYTYTASTVPVPAALPLLLTGLGGIALISRRRKRNAA